MLETPASRGIIVPWPLLIILLSISKNRTTNNNSSLSCKTYFYKPMPSSVVEVGYNNNIT